MTFMQVHDAAEVIRVEFRTTPELRLTFWQVGQLCHLSDELCERALGTLIRSGFLMTADGVYQRRSHAAAVAAIEALVRAM